jgi:hypothetical protein
MCIILHIIIIFAKYNARNEFKNNDTSSKTS